MLRCMADRRDVDFTYSLTDRIIRLSLGELADFSGSEVRRGLLAGPRAGAAAQARLCGRTGRDRAGAAPARPRLRLGSAARLRPGARRRRGRGDALLGATDGLPPARARGLPRGRARDRPGALRRASTPWRASARLSISAPRRTIQAGRQEEIYRDLFARVASVLPAGGPLLPADDGLRSQHDPGVADRPRGAPSTPAAGLRRVVHRAAGPPVPGLLATVRPGAGRPVRRAALPAGVERQRPPRLHRDDRRWNARIGAPSFRKTLLKLRLLPRWLTSADFRLAFTSGVSANQVCFERELLDHYRLVFENKS